MSRARPNAIPFTRAVTAAAVLLAMSCAGATAAPFEEAVRRGLQKHPVDAMALGLALALPVVGVAIWLVRLVVRSWQRRDGPPRLVTGGRGLGRRAWIELPGGTPPVRLGELARIGRGEDCELALGNPHVGETHALIQRTPDADFVIFDVSAEPGRGITVNGEPQVQVKLSDGDRIDVGGSEMIFRIGRAGETGAPSASRL